jgi:hypothetical protein
MPAISSARWAGTVIAVVAGACVALAGCGGKPGDGSLGGSAGSAAANAASAATSPHGPSPASSPATGNGTASTTTAGKLTGNFCTDFMSMGEHPLKLPAVNGSSLSDIRQHDGAYLKAAGSYFNGLAAEVPPKVGAWLRAIGSSYESLAGNVSGGGLSSLSQIEKQALAVTSTGKGHDAFTQLYTYLVTHCH